MDKKQFSVTAFEGITASAVVGFNAGYGHENQSTLDLKQICEDLKVAADKVEQNHGVYVSGSVSIGDAYYKNEWGCPFGGEDVFTLCATCNTTYKPEGFTNGQYISLWREAWVELLHLIMEKYDQTAVTTNINGENFYLKRS